MDTSGYPDAFQRGPEWGTSGTFYQGGGNPKKIAYTLPLTTEELQDEDGSIVYLAIRKALGWTLTPEQEQRWASNAGRVAEAAEKRKRVRESTPVVPLTVEALLGLLCDTFRLDETEVRHMIQSWCLCETDGENGMWRCEHYNDTF